VLLNLPLAEPRRSRDCRDQCTDWRPGWLDSFCREKPNSLMCLAPQRPGDYFLTELHALAYLGPEKAGQLFAQAERICQGLRELDAERCSYNLRTLKLYAAEAGQELHELVLRPPSEILEAVRRLVKYLVEDASGEPEIPPSSSVAEFMRRYGPIPLGWPPLRVLDGEPGPRFSFYVLPSSKEFKLLSKPSLRRLTAKFIAWFVLPILEFDLESGVLRLGGEALCGGADPVRMLLKLYAEPARRGALKALAMTLAELTLRAWMSRVLGLSYPASLASLGQLAERLGLEAPKKFSDLVCRVEVSPGTDQTGARMLVLNLKAVVRRGEVSFVAKSRVEAYSAAGLVEGLRTLLRKLFEADGSGETYLDRVAKTFGVVRATFIELGARVEERGRDDLDRRADLFVVLEVPSIRGSGRIGRRGVVIEWDYEIECPPHFIPAVESQTFRVYLPSVVVSVNNSKYRGVFMERCARAVKTGLLPGGLDLCASKLIFTDVDAGKVREVIGEHVAVLKVVSGLGIPVKVRVMDPAKALALFLLMTFAPDKLSKFVRLSGDRVQSVLATVRGVLRDSCGDVEFSRPYNLRLRSIGAALRLASCGALSFEDGEIYVLGRRVSEVLADLGFSSEKARGVSEVVYSKIVAQLLNAYVWGGGFIEAELGEVLYSAPSRILRRAARALDTSTLFRVLAEPALGGVLAGLPSPEALISAAVEKVLRFGTPSEKTYTAYKYARELLGGAERLFMELAKIDGQYFIASGEFYAQLYEASGKELKWLIFRKDAGVGFTFTGRTLIEAVRKASRLYDDYLESYREMYRGRAREQKSGARMVVAVDEEGRQLGEDNPAWNIAVTVNRVAKGLESALG